MAHEAAFELARRQVGDEAHLLAHQCLRLVVHGDAAHDGAVFQSVGNLEFQELLHLRHALAGEHRAHADVEFLKVGESDVGLHGLCLVGGLCHFLLALLQLGHLRLHHAVLDFLEQQCRLADFMAGGQQVGCAERRPRQTFHSQHLFQFCGGERQERLEGDGKVGHELQREVDDGLHALGVGLDDFPRLCVGEIFVADAGEVHRLFLRVAEAEAVEQALHVSLHVLKLVDCGAVGVVEFAAGGHDAVVVFLCELQGAVHEVAIHGHEFVVVACLEVLPRKVVVLRLRRVGGQHIAQHVLLAGQFLEVFVEPHRPAARGADFVVLEVEELVGGHVVGQDIRPLGF